MIWCVIPAPDYSGINSSRNPEFVPVKIEDNWIPHHPPKAKLNDNDTKEGSK